MSQLKTMLCKLWVAGLKNQHQDVALQVYLSATVCLKPSAFRGALPIWACQDSRCQNKAWLTQTMCCRGFIRGLGLSANQALHLPGAGDFAMDQIQGPHRPEPTVTSSTKRSWGEADMEVDKQTPVVLGTADNAERESLQRENQPDPLDAEQTWPTEEASSSNP